MAKATAPQGETIGDAAASTLAERLFVANWNPSSGYTVESMAAKCIEAAEAFERVRANRSELRVAKTA